MEKNIFLKFSTSIFPIFLQQTERKDVSWEQPTCWMVTKRRKTMVSNPFLKHEGVISYLEAIRWFVVSHIFQSSQRKCRWPLSRGAYHVSVRADFLFPFLSELLQRTGLFQTSHSSVLTLFMLQFVSGNFKIACTFCCKHTTLLAVEPRFPADPNDEGHQHCSVLLLGTWIYYGCQNELLVHL